jgi:alpha-ketoglutarate-dependent taurine dioxygenase
LLKFSSLFATHDGPLLVEPASGQPSLTESLVPSLHELKQQLLEHGAILFRHFRMQNVEEFDRCMQEMSNSHMEYVYRSTPRSVVTARVSTATSYPPQREIPLHNENSYQRTWPLTIAFCCIQPAAEGGETPIASMRDVSSAIGEALLDKFERCGVEYIRHYHPGVDLSWQNVFQTNSRVSVEQYCVEHGIEIAWLKDDLLRTLNVAQGVARHPVMGNRIFFNQAHLFHVSSLGKVQAAALLELFGRDQLPRHSRFGNREEITDAELEQINAAFKANAQSFRWQAGDVLWLDNMQYAHGRRPFKGDRSVFASLMEPYSVSDTAVVG